MYLLLGSRSALIALFGIGALAGAVACGNDASQIDEGKQAVTTHACAMCHGAMDGTLSGQTEAQPGTMAYPANLTPDMNTGMGEWTTDQIVAAILTGLDDEGEHLCPPMPKFGSMGMSNDEAKNIAAYLKSLPPVMHQINESTCPEKSGGDTGTGGATGSSGGGAAGK